MSITCVACGGEYVAGGFYAYHPESKCPLYHLGTLELLSVKLINEALEQAKSDSRKGEDCKYWMRPTLTGNYACVEESFKVPRRCCPCVNFKKED